MTLKPPQVVLAVEEVQMAQPPPVAAAASKAAVGGKGKGIGKSNAPDNAGSNGAAEISAAAGSSLHAAGKRPARKSISAKASATATPQAAAAAAAAAATRTPANGTTAGAEKHTPAWPLQPSPQMVGGASKSVAGSAYTTSAVAGNVGVYGGVGNNSAVGESVVSLDFALLDPSIRNGNGNNTDASRKRLLEAEKILHRHGSGAFGQAQPPNIAEISKSKAEQEANFNLVKRYLMRLTHSHALLTRCGARARALPPSHPPPLSLDLLVN